MTDVSVGRTRVEVQGHGTPVVFVHGLAGTSNVFQAMLDSFSGFRCIRPDLPGSGRSPLIGELTIERMAATVIQTVKLLAGAPAHIVAHSMGTLVAQHVAVEAGDWVRSLTLFGPIAEPADAMRERLRSRAVTARNEGLVGIADAAAAAGISASTRSSSPLAAALVRESHMRQDVEGFAQSCEALANAKSIELQKLRCPVLVVTGEDDGVAPPIVARSLAERIDGAGIQILERCGHWTPVELPERCGELAVNFIRSLER